MRKFGNFWVPDSDAKGMKNRKKMIAAFGEKDGSVESLKLAIDHMLSNFQEQIHQPGSAIDAGANVGSYTRVLADHFAVVHAFEPAHDTFQCLERNVYEGGHFHKVHLHNAAVSDERAYVGMKRSWLRLSITSTVSEKGEIPAVPLDVLKLDDLRFLKLDVEGFEYKALLGARKTIMTCRPAVFMEVKPADEERAAEPYQAEKLLLSMGYTLALSVGINRLYYPST
jgi:FkbM family methyltransferase